jgi:hypothetical protein
VGVLYRTAVVGVGVFVSSSGVGLVGVDFSCDSAGATTEGESDVEKIPTTRTATAEMIRRIFIRAIL